MQTKPLIIADRDIPFLEGVLEPYAEVRYLKGSAITANDVRGAEVLITRTRTRCDRALLEGSRIRLIATATIGFDHIDTDYCRSRGIRVTTAAGCNARGVLQYIMAVLCRLGAEPGWQPSERTLGIVGVGHVGSLVEEYGRLLGFRVVCCDPPRMRLTPGLGFLTLDELLSLSDIVTLHVPFTTEGPDKTAGMASGEFFARMRPGSAFINCSRGPVMQDGPLLDALRKGHIAYAAIDTWNHGPRTVGEGFLRHTAHRRLFGAGQGRRNGRRRPVGERALRITADRVVSAAGHPYRTGPVGHMGRFATEPAALFRYRS